MIQALTILACAFAFRLRGGNPSLGPGRTQLARALYAAVPALCAWTLGAGPWASLAAWGAFWLGCPLPLRLMGDAAVDRLLARRPSLAPWFHGIGLGRPGPIVWRSVALLTVRGLVFTAPAGLVLGSVAVGLSGAAFGLAYVAGWTVLDGRLGRPANEWGDLVMGAGIGVAVAIPLS